MTKARLLDLPDREQRYDLYAPWLIEAVLEMRRAEDRLTDLKAQLKARAQALGKIASPEERMQAAICAYCFLPKVNANILGQVISGRNCSVDLWKAAEKIRMPCADCGVETPIVRRARLRGNRRQLRKFYGTPDVEQTGLQ